MLKNDQTWRIIYGMSIINSLFSTIIILIFFNVPSLKDFVIKTNDEDAVDKEIKKIYIFESDEDLKIIKDQLRK